MRPLPPPLAYGLAVAGLMLILLSGQAAAHGHAATIDAHSPDAWKYRLCNDMSTVAIQALNDRDKGRTMRRYPDDGGPGPAIANALVERVYAEPAISSPKRADAIGRAYCNEQLQQLSR